MKKILFIFTMFMMFVTAGCAMLGMEESTPAPATAKVDKTAGMTKFSQTPTVLNPSNRQYRRMTRARMEEESDLSPQAGSMWVNEGQGAYLFSQNKSRREGDILNVKIEGPAQKQIETKVSVIKKLLKELEEQNLRKQQMEKMENAPVTMQNIADGGKPGTGVDGQTPIARNPAGDKSDKKEDKEEDVKVDAVSTRIVERMVDGNYRVKGQEPFMIGKREYKVLVTGIIRAEDFNDEGVSSSKLLDPQFDVVSIRRSRQ